MIASNWCKKMLICFSLDIICSLKLTVFFKLHSQKTVHILEHIIWADKYWCISLHEMEVMFIYYKSNS